MHHCGQEPGARRVRRDRQPHAGAGPEPVPGTASRRNVASLRAVWEDATPMHQAPIPFRTPRWALSGRLLFIGLLTLLPMRPCEAQQVRAPRLFVVAVGI